jgi:putative ABC transport system ATP-binding protein
MSLKCTDLVLEYIGAGRVVRPVDGLSIEVERGELALLLGPSGCGKTSLLSAFASILRPASGTVALDGIEVTALRSRDLTAYRRHSAGIVFQSFNLIPSLTASENVQLPLRAAGIEGKSARRSADAVLDRVGLTERRSHLPGRLSGGEQQRVAIARALVLDPPLLLADEPTAHLDHTKVTGVMALFRELADDGRMVVIATHDARTVAFANQVIDLGLPTHPRAATARQRRHTSRRPIGADRMRKSLSSTLGVGIRSRSENSVTASKCGVRIGASVGGAARM